MRPCRFFLLSEIPDGEKRSEMGVNLIPEYEKNGIWIEYINPLFIHDSMYKMWWLMDARTFWIR
jgi:hypothetical protein